MKLKEKKVSRVIPWARLWWFSCLAVFLGWLLRVFVLETVQIQSSAMRPTLNPDSYVLLWKYLYSFKFYFKPDLNLAMPSRGSLIWLSYPDQPHVFSVKRLIAVAGDLVRIEGEDVFVNGQCLARTSPKVASKSAPVPDLKWFLDLQAQVKLKAGEELRLETSWPELSEKNVVAAKNNSFQQKILGEQPGFYAVIVSDKNKNFRLFERTIPPGFVFVLGDNRADALDSRHLGPFPIPTISGRVRPW